MNYDQIIRELREIGLEPIESKRGASKSLTIEFDRKESKIEGGMSLTFLLNRSKDFEFNSSIYEEPKSGAHHTIMNTKNQTEFFNVIKELKITNIPLRHISKRADIIETEKTIKKLTKQFKDTQFRLGERKLWLKYLKGEIDRKERSEAIKKLVIKRDGK